MPAIRTIVFYVYLVVVCILGAFVLVLIAPLLPYRSRFSFVKGCNLSIIHAMRIICGIRFNVEGREYLQSRGPFVIASNHQGDWETFFLLTLGLPISTVLKKELLYIPFFGWALARLNPIAIDRNKRTNALKQVVQKGSEHIGVGRSVLIFPEGTRTKPGALGKCTKGAAMLASKAEVAILPVVQNSGYVSSPQSWVKRAGTVKVRIGAPITADSTAALHEKMVEWLDENLTALDQRT